MVCPWPHNWTIWLDHISQDNGTPSLLVSIPCTLTSGARTMRQAVKVVPTSSLSAAQILLGKILGPGRAVAAWRAIQTLISMRIWTSNFRLSKTLMYLPNFIQSMESDLTNLIYAAWSWSQTTSGSIVANVAYDLFTSSSAGGSNQNEIMIWLVNFNAGPISSQYNSDGTPKPVASNISIAGHTW